MTLPATGPISLGQTNTELGRSSTAAISLGETAVRNLSGRTSGYSDMASLRGKSAFVPDYVPNAMDWTGITGTSEFSYGTFYSNTVTVSGINTPITLRVSSGDMSVYDDGTVGASSDLTVSILVNGNVVGSMNKSRFGGQPPAVDFNVSNGATIQFMAEISTNGGNLSGSGGGGGNFTVTNLSSGPTVLDYFGVSVGATY
jgi:hypothetical protein